MLSTYDSSNTFLYRCTYGFYLISPFALDNKASSDLMRSSGFGRSLGVADQQSSCGQRNVINYSRRKIAELFHSPKSFSISVVCRSRRESRNQSTCFEAFAKVRHLQQKRTAALLCLWLPKLSFHMQTHQSPLRTTSIGEFLEQDDEVESSCCCA